MQSEFTVVSSGESPYVVTVSQSHGAITLSCTCKAAQMRKLCKHRIAFLTGDSSILANSLQEGEFEMVSKCIRDTGLEKLGVELLDAEQRLEESKKALENLKARIQNMISAGRGER